MTKPVYVIRKLIYFGWLSFLIDQFIEYKAAHDTVVE